MEEHSAGFEVLTVVAMKSYVFWDVTPCSPLKGNWPPKHWLTFNELHSVISQKINRLYLL
jgi:hypothetical protein